MICYAKYESKSDLWLKCDGSVVRWNGSGEQALLKWVRRHGRLLLMFDGFKASRYQAFVEENRNAFYQQIMSIPHLFYDFERVCLPTMHSCAIEAGIGFEHVGIGELDPACYLTMMEHTADWAHEYLSPSCALHEGTSVLTLSGE